MLLVLTALALTSHDLASIGLYIPYGIEDKVVYVTPNSTLMGILTIESHSNSPITCIAEFKCLNCTIRPSKAVLRFNRKFEAKAVQLLLKIFNSNARLLTRVRCGDMVEVLERDFILRRKWHVNVDLIAPSDEYCRPNWRLEPYTFVLHTYMPAFLRFITGQVLKGHPDLIGLMCIRVLGNGVYTVLIKFETLDGRPAPFSSISLELHEGFNPSYGIIVLQNVIGWRVFPVFTWRKLEDVVGEYKVEVLIYPQGSSNPIVEREYKINLVVIHGEALLLALISAFIGMPVLAFSISRFIKNSRLKELAFASICASLIYVIVTIPSLMLRGIAAFLGPFDWIVYGLFWDFLEFAILYIAISLYPKFGLLSTIFTIRALLSFIISGKSSLIYILWLGTSALFYELTLWLSGATRGAPTTFRTSIPLVTGGALDRYVDMIIYMTLYRLYYADWYLAGYVIGTTIYSALGVILGSRLVKYVKSVLYE